MLELCLSRLKRNWNCDLSVWKSMVSDSQTNHWQFLRSKAEFCKLGLLAFWELQCNFLFKYLGVWYLQISWLLEVHNWIAWAQIQTEGLKQGQYLYAYGRTMTILDWVLITLESKWKEILVLSSVFSLSRLQNVSERFIKFDLKCQGTQFSDLILGLYIRLSTFLFLAHFHGSSFDIDH